MPKKNDNLGKGSITVRNFIHNMAKSHGHKRYWCLDDNMTGYYRFHKSTRIKIKSPVVFRICEDFCDRYKKTVGLGFIRQ